MNRVKGVLLIAAGAGIAAYTLSPGLDLGRKAPSEHINLATSPPAPVRLAVVSEPREPAAESPRPAAAAREQELRSPSAPSTTAASPSPQWPPYVTNPQRGGVPSRLPLALSSESDDVAGNRASLTRDLQRELRRVGCYEGEINGAWTQSTRRAMKVFTDRVNASLPLEQPDHVLLALVRNHPDNTCERPCPEGQGMGETGRCLPNAILARAGTRGSARLSAGTAPTGLAPEPPASVIIGRSTSMTEPPEGRMALAGPRLDGQSLAPAVPMASSGVSLLPGAGTPRSAPPQRAPQQAAEPQGSSWARTFWKRRDSIF
jgi:hypothetical protein